MSLVKVHLAEWDPRDSLAYRIICRFDDTNLGMKLSISVVSRFNRRAPSWAGALIEIFSISVSESRERPRNEC